MLTDQENKKLNFRVDQLQRSSNFEKDYTKLHLEYLYRVQKMVFNTARIKFDLSDEYRNSIGFYDHYVLAETMLRCLERYRFQNGKDFYTYFWVSSMNFTKRQMKYYKRHCCNKIQVDPQEINTTADNGIDTIEEINSKYDLGQKEANIAKVLANNVYSKTDKQLMVENNIAEKTFYRNRKKLKDKIKIYIFEKSDSKREKNRLLIGVGQNKSFNNKTRSS